MPRLDLRICGARNLPNTQTFGKIDPYCTVSLEGKQWRTDTAENTTNPEWNAVFKFNVADADSSRLHFVIWDKNMMSDDFLGEYYMSISGLDRGQVEDKWVLLSNCKGNAELHVRMMAVDFGDVEEKEETPPHPEYRPMPQGYQPPPQQGYPQQGGGYPQQGGYPPQQGGYPPQQGGYPPQQGYPQQGGYPPQQGGYPPQQGGYPPQQGGYPPQQQQWQQPPPQQQPPQQSDKLMLNQTLGVGQKIESGNTRAAMVLQGDGNLVLYVDGAPLWASNTNGQQVTHAQLQPDGLRVFNGGAQVFHQPFDGAEALVMQGDCNLVAYAPGGRPVWATNTCR